jgi:hypothetical protein
MHLITTDGDTKERHLIDLAVSNFDEGFSLDHRDSVGITAKIGLRAWCDFNHQLIEVIDRRDLSNLSHSRTISTDFYHRDFIFYIDVRREIVSNTAVKACAAKNRNRVAHAV